MTISRIDPLSAGKVLGVLYAALGLIGGVFFGLFVLIGFLASAQEEFPNVASAFGPLIGIAFVILFPFVYGAMGAIFGLLGALLYNLVAGLVGGIELETS